MASQRLWKPTKIGTKWRPPSSTSSSPCWTTAPRGHEWAFTMLALSGGFLAKGDYRDKKRLNKAGFHTAFVLLWCRRRVVLLFLHWPARCWPKLLQVMHGSSLVVRCGRAYRDSIGRKECVDKLFNLHLERFSSCSCCKFCLTSTCRVGAQPETMDHYWSGILNACWS